MKNVIEIDGHKAVVAFDPEIRLLRGEFVGLNGAADFLAETVDDLFREGRVSLKVFIDLCDEKGIAPFREYSGRFNVRLDSGTHEAAVLAAAASNQSLNDWVSDAIRQAAEQA